MEKKKSVGRPLKYPTPELLQNKVTEYFETEEDVLTVTGLVLHLDLTYEGFAEYGRRDGFSAIVKKAKMRIEDHVNKAALKGGYIASVAIFNLKNNFGWKDKIEQEITQTTLNIDMEQ